MLNKLWTDPVWSKVIATCIGGLGIIVGQYIWPYIGLLQPVPPQIQVKGSSNPLSNVLLVGDKLHFGLENVGEEGADKVLWIVDEEKLIDDKHEHKAEYIFLPGKTEHRIDAFFKIGSRYESASKRISLVDHMELAKGYPTFHSSVSLPPNSSLEPDEP